MTYEKTFRVEMTVRVVGNEELTGTDAERMATAIRDGLRTVGIGIDGIRVLPPNPPRVYGVSPLALALEAWHRELHEVKP